MNRTDFVRELFKFFGKNDENLMRTYDVRLSVNMPIDWDKLFGIMIDETPKRILPMPKDIKAQFNRCLIPDKIGGKYDGIKLRVVLKHTTYDYETFNNNSTVYELKKSAIKRWKDNLISFQVFDEETLKWQEI